MCDSAQFLESVLGKFTRGDKDPSRVRVIGFPSDDKAPVLTLTLPIQTYPHPMIPLDYILDYPYTTHEAFTGSELAKGLRDLEANVSGRAEYNIVIHQDLTDPLM